MTKEITCTDGPIGDVKVVRDTLPAPSDLAFQEEQVNVTISLRKSSVDFFKKEARPHHTPYQKMIRRLLDLYVSPHQ